MNNKNSKRALLTSVLSLAVCGSMLVGTTFAWFTDSVSSNNNVITAGNLDIEVEYTKDGTNWDYLDGKSVFDEKTLWEPGHTEVVALKVSNVGSLALKYKVDIDIVSETVGKNAAGEDIVLSEILQAGTLPLEGEIGKQLLSYSFSSREAMQNVAMFPLSDYVVMEETTLFVDDAHYLVVAIEMPATIGNEANYDKNKGEVPSIKFGLNVVATQATVEKDSFGNGYDANAGYADVWTGKVATPDELAAVTDDEAKTIEIDSPELLAAFANAVNEGNTYGNYTVSLEKDIDLNNVNWTPIGNETNFFRGIFDGQGHTISNLRCNGGAANPQNVNARYQGLFGYMYTNGSDYVCDIINLTLNNVDIYAACSAGAFVGAVDAQPGLYWFRVGQVTLKNLKLTGKVTIEGNYSGGVAGGKSDTWPGLVALVNVEVNVEDGSYVSNVVASAGSDSHAVGGVIAIAPYGVKQDITSNIDVIGNGGTVGGIAAVGGFDWTNVTCTGDVTVKNATEATYQGNGTVIGKLVPQSAAPGEIVNISGTGALRIEIGDEVRTTNGQESNTIGCLAW